MLRSTAEQHEHEVVMVAGIRHPSRALPAPNVLLHDPEPAIALVEGNRLIEVA